MRGDISGVVRVVRIGRLYKLVKLTRLLRVLKIVKGRSKMMKYLDDVMKIGVGAERLLFFIIISIMLIHIVACLWVFFA